MRLSKFASVRDPIRFRRFAETDQRRREDVRRRRSVALAQTLSAEYACDGEQTITDDRGSALADARLVTIAGDDRGSRDHPRQSTLAHIVFGLTACTHVCTPCARARSDTRQIHDARFALGTARGIDGDLRQPEV